MESVNIKELNERIQKESAFVDLLSLEMGKVIVGQKHLVENLMIAMLADGHILLEGVPGLAKTLAISTLARAVDARFSRIQFTPDLLPADVTGTLIYSQKKEQFEVHKGPIFANFVLADRFMLKVVVGYPGKEEEKLIIRMNNSGAFPQAQPVVSPADIIRAREVVREVYMDEKIERYIVDIVYATRTPEEYGLKGLKDLISFGGSPRASISLSMAAKAYAFIKRRGYVIPEDVRAVCPEVLRHRIGLTYEAEAENVTPEQIIEQVINAVIVP